MQRFFAPHDTAEQAFRKVLPCARTVVARQIDALLAGTAKETPQEAEVIAVGPGKVTHDGKRQPMSVKVGDKILFGKYSGNEVKLDGEEYLIMREEDVLGVLQ